MSLKKNTFVGVVWLSFANSANQIVTLIVFIILARHLDLRDFGLVMLAILIINIFTIFFKEGVVEYLVRRNTWEERAASTAFWIMALAGLVLTAILAGLIGPALQHYYGGDISAYILTLSPVILLGCLSVVHVSLVRRNFHFRLSATRNFSNGLLTGVIAVFMAISGYGAWSLIVSRVIGAFGAAIILWAQEPYQPNFVFSITETRAIARYSIPVLFARFLTYLASKSPDLLLSALIGPAALAIYRVGSRLIETFNTLLLDPVANVLVTTFAAIRAEGADRAFRRVMRLLSAIMLPIYVGAAAIALQLTIVFYGSKWEQSGWVMLLLCLQIAPILLRSIIGVVYKSVGQANRLSLLGVIELILSVSLIYLAALLGPVAVAGSMLIYMHLIAALFLHYGQRDLNLNIGKVLSCIWPFVFSAFSLGVCVFVFNNFLAVSVFAVWQLAAGIALGIVLYPLILMIFFPRETQHLVQEVSPLIPRRLGFILRVIEKLLSLRLRKSGAELR